MDVEGDAGGDAGDSLGAGVEGMMDASMLEGKKEGGMAKLMAKGSHIYLQEVHTPRDDLQQPHVECSTRRGGGEREEHQVHTASGRDACGGVASWLQSASILPNQLRIQLFWFVRPQIP